MVAKKMVSGQMFWGPIMLPVFFTYNELLAGRGFEVFKLDLNLKFINNIILI